MKKLEELKQTTEAQTLEVLINFRDENRIRSKANIESIKQQIADVKEELASRIKNSKDI